MAGDKEFSFNVIKITVSIVVLFLALNLFIDPYNRFGFNTMGVYISAEREFKVTEISSFEPEWVLLGNSKSAMIDVSGLGNNKVFNAGFGSASIEEMIQFIQRYVPEKKVKLLIGLDILQYSEGRGLDKDFFYVNTFDNIQKYLFSLKSLEYCGKTLSKYFRNKPKTLLKNGSYNSVKWFEYRDIEDKNRMIREIKHTQMAYLDKKAYKDEFMLGYLKLKQVLESKGIKAVFFIHPLHEEVNKFVKSNLGEDLRKWKEKIKEIFPELKDFSDSHYSKEENFFRTDPIHYYPSVGKSLINGLLKESI